MGQYLSSSTQSKMRFTMSGGLLSALRLVMSEGRMLGVERWRARKKTGFRVYGGVGLSVGVGAHL
jgi:hypothetical protein